MRFFIDKDGYPEVDLGYEYHVLADFLSGDIQGSLRGVNEYLDLCESVKNGELLQWEGTGNAHTVTIKLDSVEIFNEYTEESLTISTIEEFRSYLERWKELLLSRK
ncbi:hypothetical protein CKY10_03855 [Photorhabdus sp. HUG-39]|uniref:CdiI immunity protein domain-containing protein n=2 Tax=Photorhabdus TaxID=29487 RepID=A0ABX0AW35_9GAMM|nr:MULTISPECIES: hypothetical protein [Photorhabdus]MCC8376555.1 hypothetical protein [Photorhabdus bodei]MDB6371830.1 hypothetical protein [Photorhabdus bodei]NDL10935.1 hypothetical protein [Photorhabdus kayaii]NDL24594.1 hypothetical protein [Photorhabdus kayaii]RAX11284.1 hypothetical protein CKY10_03855 [Photorhabdus sp. HUG-39]